MRGYLNGLEEMAKDDREKWHEYRIDNSPPLIRDLLEGALRSRASFLGRYVDLETGRFTSTDEAVPHSAHCEAFQGVVDRYVEENGVEPVHGRDGYFTVRDGAVKKGSGTASLGLDRLWALVEGPDPDDVGRGVVLELKQARRSALVGGDRLYGRAEVEGVPFLVRERSPLKAELDVGGLDEDGLRAYAAVCGRRSPSPTPAPTRTPA